MGVTFLWHILDPVKQHVPLNSLSGKTLAVDLSLWVCEAQTVKKMIGVVTKPHLRNLFFRVSSLTLMGVKLVFVTEGEAPKVKAETMKMRNEMRYGPSKSTGTTRPGRSYFKSVLKECLVMLESLGIPWVQAAGEAEAMCAYLTANGYVDGCITNDGDVFLYGAPTVYRNFTMNIKDPHVDCYTMSSIKDNLALDRDALVGIAVLLGCDYLPKGIPGVGKDQALKLIEMLKGQSVLQRFEQWADEFQNGKMSAVSLKKLTHCSTCCHPGSTKDHLRNGCKLCGSNQYCEPHDYSYLCPCAWHRAQREKKTNTLENTIKRKAWACSGFPFREVIQEFLLSKDKLVRRIMWLRPNLLSFQNFAYVRMEWPKHYACEKVLMLLTYYDMTERAAGRGNSRQLQATRILKTRVRNGTPCFEIQWEKPEHYVFSDDQALETFLVSIEEESLFQAAYPDIVALYTKEKLENDDKKLKSKKNKPKVEKASDPNDIADLILQLSLQPKIQTYQMQNSTSDFMPFPNSRGLQKGSSDSKFAFKPLHLHLELQKDSCASEDLPLSADSSSGEVFLPGAEVIASNPLSVANPAEQIHASGNAWASPAHGSKRCFEAPSPNVSSLISELQLSNIDWEATSFCSSPQVEAAPKSAPKIRTDEREVLTCGNSTNQPQSRAAKGNAENTSPLLIPQAPSDRNGVCHIPNDVFTAVPLHRRPLQERILLKNGCQLSGPQPQKQQYLNTFVPQPLPLAECRKQASYSWSGNTAISRSFCTLKAEKILPVEHRQGSVTHGQVGFSRKTNTSVQILGEKAKSYMFKPRVRSVEAEKTEKASASRSLKTSAMLRKEVSAVSAAGKIDNKSGLEVIVKKSVCRSPPHSSGEDSDTGGMRGKMQTHNAKQHREKCDSAPGLLIHNYSDKLHHRSAEIKKTECEEETQGSRDLFVFDNEAALPLGSTSSVHSSNEISPLQSHVHRPPFTEPPGSPEPHSDSDDSILSIDSPLPLLERLKLRLQLNT